jgi:hypothetical protein
MYRAMLLGAILSGLSVSPAALAAPHVEEFHAVFSGFNEVGGLNAQTGAILSDGRATLELRLNRADQTLSFVLKYSGLAAGVTQAHIHFGKIHMAGGVMVFFCSNDPATSPPGTQPCPANSGTVTGTLSAANVVGPAKQGVTAGDFQAIVDALESDTAYANIHTTAFPAGEIRGEIRRGFSFGVRDE